MHKLWAVVPLWFIGMKVIKIPCIQNMNSDSLPFMCLHVHNLRKKVIKTCEKVESYFSFNNNNNNPQCLCVTLKIYLQKRGRKFFFFRNEQQWKWRKKSFCMSAWFPSPTFHPIYLMNRSHERYLFKGQFMVRHGKLTKYNNEMRTFHTTCLCLFVHYLNSHGAPIEL